MHVFGKSLGWFENDLYNFNFVKPERLRVRIQAGAVEEFSSPELTLCADLFGVHSTPMLLQRHVKGPVHLPKVQVAGYT